VSFQRTLRINDGEVLVAGGFVPGAPLSSSELYTPSTGTWTATGGMTNARGSASAVLLGSGQVLVAGGQGTGGTYITGSEVYTPSTGTWTATAAMTTARGSDTMTVLSGGQVLIAGGEASDGSAISAAEVFNDQVSPTITPPTTLACTYGTPVSTAVVTLTDAPIPSTVTYTATGLPSWATLNASSGVLSGTPTAVTTAPITVTVTASNGVSPNGVSTFQLSVTPAPLIVSANSVAKVYGQANPALTASYIGLVNGDTSTSLGGTLSLATSATSGSGVGSYTITPSGLSSSNYSISYVTGSLIVTPAPLIVSANSESKVYGQSNPALSVGYSGFVNGDSASNLTGTLSLNTSAGSGSGVGSYTITPSGLSSSNYSISFVNGTLSISPAPLTVSANSVSKVYGQSNPTLTASYTGFVNGDSASSLTGTLTLSTTAASGSGVGSYPITPSGPSSSNYSVAFVPGTLSITPAPLTISAGSETKVYGQANPTLTAGYSGFVNGDSASSLTGTLSLSTSATSASGVGGYPITPSGPSSSNYSIAFVPGTLTITPAPLTVSAVGAVSVYGQALPTLTATYSGFVNGDTASSLIGTLSLNTSAGSGSGAGTYPITPSGLGSSNYTISFVPAALTITPAVLTVSADPKSKVYGQANPALTVSYSGFVNGDTLSSLTGLLSVSTTATTGSGVGSYAITPHGPSSSNYTIAFVPGMLTVTPAPLTVSADWAVSVYGQAFPALTAGYSGFVNGDSTSSLTGTLTLTTTATSGSGAGSFPISAGGLSASNYTITFVPGTLTITPAPLTVSADSKLKDYGEANPTLTASYSGFVNGDTLSSLSGTLSLSTSATSGSGAGSYPITPGGLSSNNYAIRYVPGTLIVSPALLTVTAANATRAFGQANPSFTASSSGFVNGDTAGSLSGTLSFSTTATASSGAGTYPITPGGVSSPNYSIVFVNGQLTVTSVSPASQTIEFTPPADPVTFGSGPLTLSAVASSGLPVTFSVVSGPGSVSGDTLTVTGAGTIVVEADQAGNAQYAAAPAVQQTVVVEKAADSITFAAIPVVPLGAAPFALGAVGGGSSSPVDYTVLTGPGSVSGNTLTVKALGTVLIEAAQAGDANYTAATPVILTVTVGKAQTIKFNPSTHPVTYGVKPITLTGTASSKLPVTYNVVSGPGTIVGNKLTVTGAGNIVIAATQAGNSAYAAASVVEKTIVVNKATVTVTAKNTTWTAGESGQLLAGFTVSGFVNGDTLASVFGSEEASVTCPTVNAGDPVAKMYAILASQGSLVTPANYKLVFKNGTLTVKA
jgi:hypothetical protein